MARPLLTLLASGLVVCVGLCGPAQADGVGTPNPATSVVPSPTINANPMLAAIVRLDPQLLPSVARNLEQFTRGRRQASFRGADPSPSETAQIKDNPAFAQAYDHNPVATLMLLRWVNMQLHQHGG